MTEAELREQVFALLAECFPTVKWTYFPDSRKVMGFRGYPDLTLCGSRGLLFRELKGSDTRHTLAQLSWLRVLSHAGANAGTWRPEDLTTRIPADLAMIS